MRLAEKYTVTQLKESKLYKKYGYILDTELDSKKTYAIADVDKKLAKYITKKV